MIFNENFAKDYKVCTQCGHMTDNFVEEGPQHCTDCGKNITDVEKEKIAVTVVCPKGGEDHDQFITDVNERRCARCGSPLTQNIH